MKNTWLCFLHSFRKFKLWIQVESWLMQFKSHVKLNFVHFVNTKLVFIIVVQFTKFYRFIFKYLYWWKQNKNYENASHIVNYDFIILCMCGSNKHLVVLFWKENRARKKKLYGNKINIVAHICGGVQISLIMNWTLQMTTQFCLPLF